MYMQRRKVSETEYKYFYSCTKRLWKFNMILLNNKRNIPDWIKLNFNKKANAEIVEVD